MARTLSGVLRKLLRVGTAGVAFVALWGHFMEVTGQRRCECKSTCWCKRPGLNAFRWVASSRFHDLRSASDG
jgi:hypothetical protein